MSPIYGEPVSLVTPWWWVPIRTPPPRSHPLTAPMWSGRAHVPTFSFNFCWERTRNEYLVSSRDISPELKREQSDEVSLEERKTVGKSRFSLTRVRGRGVLKGSSAPGKKVKRLLCLPLLGTSSSEHYSLEQTPPLSFLPPFFSSLSFFKKSPSRRDFEKKQNNKTKKNKGEEEPLARLFSSMKCFLFLLNYLGRFHWRTPSGTRWDLHPDLFVIYPLYL